MLEENPLKARRRKEDVDLNSLSPEMRYMEEQFLPFDYLQQQRKSYFPNAETSRDTSIQADQPLGETAPMMIPGSKLAAPGQVYSNGLAGASSEGLSPAQTATRVKPSGSVCPPSAGSRLPSATHSQSSRLGSFDHGCTGQGSVASAAPPQTYKPSCGAVPVPDVASLAPVPASPGPASAPSSVPQYVPPIVPAQPPPVAKPEPGPYVGAAI